MQVILINPQPTSPNVTGSRKQQFEGSCEAVAGLSTPGNGWGSAWLFCQRSAASPGLRAAAARDLPVP